MSSPQDPIRVLIADDHDLYRVGLASLLAPYSGLEVIAQASTGRMAIRLAGELKCDVILMDLRMPDISGIAATRSILEQDPSARVIALTVAGEASDVNAAVRAGVCGYLLKDAPIDDVVAAIHAAASGTAWLSPRAAEAVLEQVRQADVQPVRVGPPNHELSPREVEVLQLLARGLDNNAIAQQLSISPRTVKNHVANLLVKLGVTNRVQAAVYAIRSGIV